MSSTFGKWNRGPSDSHEEHKKRNEILIARSKKAKELYPEVFEAYKLLRQSSGQSGSAFASGYWMRVGGTSDQINAIRKTTQIPELIKDDAPLRTREYWIKQNSIYANTLNDPGFREEQKRDASIPISPLRGHENIDYRPYLPPDPAHPRAYIPADIRYAKRKAQNFLCAITGWKETDWFRDKQKRGPYRQVGRLTIDHAQAGANGGLTTDENTRMVCELANTKKGRKIISDEEVRNNILAAFEIVQMPENLLAVVNEYGIVQYKVK